MPGNEVGDRVHNFFDQGNLSQSQHHSQVVEGNWPVLSNNQWVGNQRQIGAPLISGTKNYNVQQSDSERGVASQSMRVPHGLNFTQSNLRPESAKSQPQNQQSNLNGYMQGHHAFQTRQNEANILGVDREPDRHNLVSRGLYSPETPQGNASEYHRTASMSLEAAESPVNFDFLGGQQQMNNQQQGMVQSFPRQQSGLGDMQLIQQQVLMRQMQELQRQQHIQQQEVRQHNSINQLSAMAKQAGGNHSPALINGTPIHEGSNYAWTPEVLAGNTNWLQRGALPMMHGSSNGLMFSPEQGQAMRMMALTSQGVDQSLYGFPVSSTRGTPAQYSHNHMDKSTLQHTSASSSSFPGNQYAAPDQVSLQDGTLVSRQGFEGNNLFRNSPGQGLGSGVVTKNSQQVNAQQRNASMQEFRGRQEISDSSGTLPEKTVMQVASAQSVVPLDPTEEKILFGTDDNLWDAFGRTANIGTGGCNLSDGTGFQNALPSLQSGSWSALMQSAVAETSAGDTGLQNEWSGLTFPNSDLPSGSHQLSTINDSGKQPTVWSDNNLQTATSLVSRPFLLSDDANTSTNYSTVPGFQQSGINSCEKNERYTPISSGRSIQQASEGSSKWEDHSPLQKPLVEGMKIYGDDARISDTELKGKSISGSWTHQQSISSCNPGGQPCNKLNGWNFMGNALSGGDPMLKIREGENIMQRSQSNEHERGAQEEMGRAAALRKGVGLNSTVELEQVNPDMGTSLVNRGNSNLSNVATISNLGTTKVVQETSQQFSNNHHLDHWKPADISSNSKGVEGLENYKHRLNNSLQGQNSSQNSSDKGVVETHNMDNCKSDSFRSKLSEHVSSGGLRENVWLDANETHTLPGGKQKSSGQIGRKSSGSRKFQYHPMGNLDEDVEPYYGTKLGTLSQATSQHGSRGLNSHNQGSSAESKFAGHVRRSSMELEKGLSLEYQGDTKGLDEVPSRSNFPGYVPNMSDPFDRPIGINATNKTAQARPHIEMCGCDDAITPLPHKKVSHNMLELLHKVDQSSEHGSATHIIPSNRTLLSGMPEGETSDRSVGHLQQNQSSASQGFGLQLAPPSQRVPVQNHGLASQSSSQTVDSLSLSQAIPETGVRGHMGLAHSASVQSSPPSRENSQGEFQKTKSGILGQIGNEASSYNVQGNFPAAFTSGSPYSRSRLNQHMTDSSVNQTTNQSVNTSFSTLDSRFKLKDDSHDRALNGPSAPGSLPNTVGSTSHNELAFPADISNTNHSHVRVPTQKIPVLDPEPVSEPSLKSGVSLQGGFSTMLPNTWTDVSTHQRTLGAQPHMAPSSLFNSHLQSNNKLETTFPAPQKGGDKDDQKGDSGTSESGACFMNSQGFVHGERTKESPWRQVTSQNIEPVQKVTNASEGKESIGKHHSDASLSNAAATKRDIEAFGRSLKPNYSLLHQMEGMKIMETDPSNRDLKRFKGPDCGPNGQHLTPRSTQCSSYGLSTMVRDASINHTLHQSGDAKVLSFSSELGHNRDKNQLGNTSSQDMPPFGVSNAQNLSISNNAASNKSEHSQISPRMAPSWFGQYGTFKNGQIFPINDLQKTATMNSVEPYVIRKSADGLQTHSRREQVYVAADTNQVIDVGQSSTPTSIACEHFSSPHSLPPAVTDQSLVVSGLKKRKSVTSGLLPWHKELMQGFQGLLTISMAEVVWAQAANRLVEKVEDEAEMIEDGPLNLRPKKRLILTAQLMQQLILPPPASVLAADASSTYESVAYFAARSALGNACSQLSCSGCDSLMPPEPDSGNLLPEKLKTSQKIGVQYYSKVMEDFIGRAKKLEADLLRLDKKASILDLRLDSQDLEKFSVINRFAKFHGRGQADGAESSSSSDVTTNAQKTFPQRYVTALPMPRNLPDRNHTNWTAGKERISVSLKPKEVAA